VPLLLVALAACYTQRPVATPGPEPGARISAQLTRSGSDSLTRLLGPDVAEVDGRVVEAGTDTLRVSVLSVTNQRGIPSSWRGELVPLPRAQLHHVGERHLATGGTVLLSASLVGGLYLLYRLMGGAGIIEGSGGGGGGGPR
jgi:hypothetical protein